MNAKFVQRTILIALLALAYPAASFAGYFGVGVTVGFAPPPLPMYVQPPCPAPGYMWTPGYWAFSDDDQDYYWVPGTWVLAPSFGLLWTPGFWGLLGAEYVWHEGYWGPHVGFYGGINYGFGYFGSGFEGGYWRDRDFYYNRAVSNVSSVNITNVYNRTVINNNFYNSRASFNGRNGVEARPTSNDQLAERERHRAPTEPQRSQATSARTLPSALASVNHGRPQLAATPRPGVFYGRGVTAARSTNMASAPQAHSSLSDRTQSSGSNRNTAPYAPMNARAHSSAAPQARPYTVHAQHGGNGSSPARAPAAQSSAPTARWSPPTSYRPQEQPYRATPAYAPPRAPSAGAWTPGARAPQAGAWTPAAHAPPPRQTLAQPPRNPPPPRQTFAQAPHSAPAFHSEAPPQHPSHQPPAQMPRRS
jgi:hypothetical protein